MAYRRRGRSGGSRRSRSTSRRASGRRGFSSRSRRSGSGSRGVQHTVRIVMEHPASNPMLTVPVGQTVAAPPGKARF